MSVYSHFNWLELILFAQASLNVLDPQDRGPKVGNSITAPIVVRSLGILLYYLLVSLSLSIFISTENIFATVFLCACLLNLS